MPVIALELMAYDDDWPKFWLTLSEKVVGSGSNHPHDLAVQLMRCIDYQTLQLIQRKQPKSERELKLTSSSLQKPKKYIQDNL